MALNSLQPKCLYVNIKIQILFCGTNCKQNTTRTGFDVYIRNCFPRLQEIGLFVSYDFVLCCGLDRQPVGREFEVQEKRVLKFRVGAVQDN